MLFNSAVKPFTYLDISKNDYNIEFYSPNSLLVNFGLEVEGGIRNYSLEDGGWLPIGLTRSKNFYVDRNVLTALCSDQSGKYDLNRWLSISGDVNFRRCCVLLKVGRKNYLVLSSSGMSSIELLNVILVYFAI